MSKLKKPDHLNDLLAQSFAPDKNSVKSPVVIQPPEPAPSPSKPALPRKQEYAQLIKTTVTFQEQDQRLIDAILDMLKQGTGYRGGFSDAVKIALRLCPLNESRIAKIHEEIRVGDRRTRKKS
jgi:hypothetical protein